MRNPVHIGKIVPLLALATMLSACGKEPAASADSPAASNEISEVAEQVDEADDAKVAGTTYNATAQVPCGGYRKHADGMCEAGVVRNKDKTATVTVTYPGGADSRTIFFDATGKPFGADLAEADGSAQYKLETKRKAPDVTVITIGPEHYEINDAFVMGG